MNRIAVGAAALALALGSALGLPSAAETRPDEVAATCPAALPPGPKAAAGALSAITREQPRVYPGPEYRTYQVTGLASLVPELWAPGGIEPHRGIAARRCGEEVANRSWVIYVFFPKLASSASLSQGIAFAARTSRGWIIWYRYR